MEKVNEQKQTKVVKPQSALEILAERSSELQEGTYTPQHKVTYQHGFIDGYHAKKNQSTPPDAPISDDKIREEAEREYPIDPFSVWYAAIGVHLPDPEKEYHEYVRRMKEIQYVHIKAAKRLSRQPAGGAELRENIEDILRRNLCDGYKDAAKEILGLIAAQPK